MRSVYIAIEKNVERFEQYNVLWKKRNKIGIMAATMTDGIKKAIDLEKSESSELFFISIVANEMYDFIQQLSILSAETTAPILVATENYTEKEHHTALNNGADFYAHFCETTEENIDGVMSAIKSIERRKNKNVSSNTLTYKGILISLSQRKTFVNDVHVDLTRQELDLLYYFMSNIGLALSYEQIYNQIWKDKYNESFNEAIRSAVKKLRKKIGDDENEDVIIKNLYGFGYKMLF